MYKWFFAIFCLFVFTGCGPKYIVKNSYIPPSSQSGKQCVNKCEEHLRDCRTNCEINYNNCISSAFDRAKKIARISEQNYRKRYNKYLRKLDEYNYRMVDWQNEYDQNSRDLQYFRDRCIKDKDKYACDRENDLRYVVKTLLRNKPHKPKHPKKLSFNDILLQQQNMCQKDCGCQSDYNVCFTSCGGEIISKRICVENCD